MSELLLTGFTVCRSQRAGSCSQVRGFRVPEVDACQRSQSSGLGLRSGGYKKLLPGSFPSLSEGRSPSAKIESDVIQVRSSFDKWNYSLWWMWMKDTLIQKQQQVWFLRLLTSNRKCFIFYSVMQSGVKMSGTTRGLEPKCCRHLSPAPPACGRVSD